MTPNSIAYNTANEERLIRDNIGLTWHFLRKFNRAADQEAYSAALEGLWKAARSYDETKGANFCTYASVCIYNSIAMYLRKLRRIKEHEVVSIDAPIQEASENTHVDIIPDKDTPESLYLQAETHAELHTACKKIIAQMTSVRQKTVVELWYTSGGRMTQNDIAKTTGFSQSYVSRVLSAAKHKIRQELEAIR